MTMQRYNLRTYSLINGGTHAWPLEYRQGWIFEKGRELGSGEHHPRDDSFIVGVLGKDQQHGMNYLVRYPGV